MRQLKFADTFAFFDPPSQKTMDVSPWMNAQGGPSEARLALWSTHHSRDENLRVRTYSTGRAKEGALADCAEEMKDTTGGLLRRSSLRLRRLDKSVEASFNFQILNEK